MASLFQRRMLVVSGKGGVGRTTVAAGLSVAAARMGKRVLIAQMDAHDRLPQLFGHQGPVGADIVTLRTGIDAVNMKPAAALREYGSMVLKFDIIYRALFENKPVRSFLSAVPGLDAYSMLGKCWFHTTETVDQRPRYDLVVLDAPASGHVTTMLRIPRAIVDAMPKGPLARDARTIIDFLTDEQQSLFVVVTLAEELPVNETIDLAHTVREKLQMPLGPIIVNAMPSSRLGADVFHRVLDAAGVTGDPDLDATLAGARLLRSRYHEAQRLLARLVIDPGLPCVALPRLFADDLGPREIDQLADVLMEL